MRGSNSWGPEMPLLPAGLFFWKGILEVIGYFQLRHREDRDGFCWMGLLLSCSGV